MRTKALLVGAIIGAASLVTSMAQVYSVNIVGYINVPIYPGWNLIANQLNNSAGNTVANLFTPPSSISVFTYLADKQSYDGSDYDGEYKEWTKPGLTVAPGQGCYILAGEAFNITFVGEVMTGPQTTTLYAGWNLIAPIVPQDGNIQTDLGYIPSDQGDSIFWFNGQTQKYYGADYDGEYKEWSVPPMTKVGQGFFALRSSAGTWSRNFSVSGQ